MDRERACGAKLLPTPDEARATTLRHDNLFEKIKSQNLPEALTILRVGSSFWGRNYSIRGNESPNPSDLDLEIILKPGITLPGAADYCVTKREIDGIEVSFHCVLHETFERMCNLDYENINQSVFLKEFRTTSTLTPKTYHQRNFAGETYQYTTTPQGVVNGQISEIPLVLIGDHGEILLGVALNKYLPVPDLDQKLPDIKAGIETMLRSLRNRRDRDMERMPDRSLSFTHFHIRLDRMPKHVVTALKGLDTRVI